jgi:protein-S-isoprenylcysteine O-methyltransferase Ste14
MDALRRFELACVLAFFALIAAKIVLQVRRGIWPVAVRSPLDVLLVGSLFAWLAAIGLHAAGLLSELDEPALFRSPLLRSIGTALSAGGVALFAAALFAMGRSWRIGIDERSREELVTRGVFAFSRNPIYLALDGFALGLALLHGSTFFVVSFLVLAVLVHRQILLEERFLARAHGERWDRYRGEVMRYLGRRG